MDPTQLFVIIALSVFAIATAVCAVYLVGLIQDLRKMIGKTNNILNDANSITSSIARPVSSFSDFLMGFKNGFKFFNSFFDKERET